MQHVELFSGVGRLGLRHIEALLCSSPKTHSHLATLGQGTRNFQVSGFRDVAAEENP